MSWNGRAMLCKCKSFVAARGKSCAREKDMVYCSRGPGGLVKGVCVGTWKGELCVFLGEVAMRGDLCSMVFVL